jgi:hypothetical protein
MIDYLESLRELEGDGSDMQGQGEPDQDDGFTCCIKRTSDSIRAYNPRVKKEDESSFFNRVVDVMKVVVPKVQCIVDIDFVTIRMFHHSHVPTFSRIYKTKHKKRSNPFKVLN